MVGCCAGSGFGSGARVGDTHLWRSWNGLLQKNVLTEVRYLAVTTEEQRHRLDERQAREPHTTWRMSDEELARWASLIDVPTPGELDGSEPLDDPPAPCATWEEWRLRRWPPAL